MKSKIIFLFNIILIIIIAIMLFTVSLRKKISNGMFDNLMFLFGILCVITIVIFIIVLVKSRTK
ncbi:MAG: hypothetical protein ACJAX4_000942 [Clostridium sp.]|jgi:hypothetical protein